MVEDAFHTVSAATEGVRLQNIMFPVFAGNMMLLSISIIIYFSMDKIRPVQVKKIEKSQILLTSICVNANESLVHKLCGNQIN